MADEFFKGGTSVNYGSGRYGADSDGGVGSIDAGFTAQRKRHDKNMKSFNKLNEWLNDPAKRLLIEGAAWGAKEWYKHKTDQLEADDRNRNAAWSIVNDKHNKFYADYTNHIKEGGTDTSFIHNYITNERVKKIGEQLGNENFNELHYRAGVHKQVSQLKDGDDLYDSVATLIRESKDVPFMSAEDFDKFYFKDKNFFDIIKESTDTEVASHNEETLRHDNDKAADIDPSNGRFKEYGDVKTAFEAYHLIEGSLFNVHDQIEKGIKDNSIKGKVTKAEVIVENGRAFTLTTTTTPDGEIVQTANPVLDDDGNQIQITDEVGIVAQVLKTVKNQSGSYKKITEFLKSDNGKNLSGVELFLAIDSLIDPKDKDTNISRRDQILNGTGIQEFLIQTGTIMINGEKVGIGMTPPGGGKKIINPAVTVDMILADPRLGLIWQQATDDILGTNSNRVDIDDDEENQFRIETVDIAEQTDIRDIIELEDPAYSNIASLSDYVIQNSGHEDTEMLMGRLESNLTNFSEQPSFMEKIREAEEVGSNEIIFENANLGLILAANETPSLSFNLVYNIEYDKFYIRELGDNGLSHKSLGLTANLSSLFEEYMDDDKRGTPWDDDNENEITGIPEKHKTYYWSSQNAINRTEKHRRELLDGKTSSLNLKVWRKFIVEKYGGKRMSEYGKLFGNENKPGSSLYMKELDNFLEYYKNDPDNFKVNLTPEEWDELYNVKPSSI